MIILDSNVISALMNDPPEDKVVTWLDRQPLPSIWTTSISILEIRSGLQMMPAGKKQAASSEIFSCFLGRIEHRIAAFDHDAADIAATLVATRKRKGKVVELRDTMIASIVLSQHASLATRNVSHFDDITATVVNPWTT